MPLSFWGGVDPVSGIVVDSHHPLHGQCVTGTILALPSGRGSCSGTGTIIEMLLGGTAPAALVFSHREPILTLGVLIARELFGQSIPVLQLDEREYGSLAETATAAVADEMITGVAGHIDREPVERVVEERVRTVQISELDQLMLDGALGEAARVAMRIVLATAELEGATELIDVEQAHVDGVFYQGPGSLRFATTLRDLGATVRVPTTMNAICVDRARWRDQGVAAAMGEPSEQLADAYEQMGVAQTYTCAPYLLAGRPRFGQQVASAESNAVVFTNSALGARTMKYPDYLDILIALTGRAPDAGAHRDAGRRPTALVEVDVEPLDQVDDSLFPILGYLVGGLAPNDIPVITGLETYPVSADDLKAFGAAFATTSAVSMFHLVGATPEAPTLAAATGGTTPDRCLRIGRDELLDTWRELSTAAATEPEVEVDLVALGNPHFSLTELAALADLVRDRRRHPRVSMMITCGREIYAQAQARGYVARIEEFGGVFVNDACWCFIDEPVIPPTARTIVTTSGKYAHYGASALGRGMQLRSLRDCVDAACTGRVPTGPPTWLLPPLDMRGTD